MNRCTILIARVCVVDDSVPVLEAVERLFFHHLLAIQMINLMPPT